MKTSYNISISISTVIILLFVFSCKTNIQSSTHKKIDYILYYLEVYKADSLYTAENYPESYKILDNLFKEYKPIDYKKEISQYIKLGHRYKNGNTKYFIKEHIVNFKYNPAFLENNKELDEIFHSYYTTAELNQFYEEGQKKINWKLRKEILEINESDQNVRNGDDAHFSKIRQIDSINAIKLQAIFKNYGYPDEVLIGRNNIDQDEIVDLTTTLMHISIENKTNYFYDVILKYVKEGSCLPINYAFMVDYENKKNPSYGTFINQDKIKSYSVKAIEQINKNRKAIGLNRLK